MGNRTYIDVFKKENLRSGVTDYCIDISDDYSNTTLMVSKEEIPDDDMELLKKVIEFKHRPERFGTSSETIEEILDLVIDTSRGINIGDKFYSYVDMIGTIDYDLRTVYECPECDWESYDDDDNETTCQGCALANMEKVREEWYEK